MKTTSLVIISMAIAMLFACNNSESPFIPPGGGTGGGSGSGVSTSVTNLNALTSVPDVVSFLEPEIKEVLMSDDGSVIMIVSAEDFGATNPDGLHQIYRVDEASGLVTKITNFTNANNTGDTSITVSLAQVPVNLLPVLSGDGSTIAYIHTYDPLGTNADGSPELFVIDVATGTLTQPTNNLFTTISVLKPSITNDGSTLAFVSRDDYNVTNPDTLDQIYTITTDGLNTINQITSNTLAGVSTGGYMVGTNGIENYEYSYYNQGIAISGDGSRIAFQGSGDWLNDGSLSGGENEIFIINIDGSNLLKVSSAGTNNLSNPQISDDGNILAFEMSNGGNPFTDLSNIYAYNVTTVTLTNLTNNTDDMRFHQFALTGDGSTVIYRFQNDIQNTAGGSLDFLAVASDGLTPSTEIFTIPSIFIENINSFSWTQLAIPDFIFYPKTTTNGSKTVFGTATYKLPPSTSDHGNSQLYLATKP